MRAGFFLALVLLCLIANRGAFKGYFHGDDLDNIFWTSQASAGTFLSGMVSPILSSVNFRPTGHFYFFALSHVAALKFTWYVAMLQFAHLLNSGLLYLLLRRMKFAFPAAAAGMLFFAFEMAVFDAFWKPMYVFDVLCATFCLLSLLSYSQRRYVLSFVCLWIGYKAKELAIMLPLVLAAWEWWFGEKKWKRLVPFFAFSLLFGLQAIWSKPAEQTEYSLTFSAAAISTTLSYYSSAIFFLPFAGLATLLVPFFIRDKRVWLGVAGFWVLLAPLLLLPGRLYAAYLYLPLVLLSIAVAGIAERFRPVWLLLFFALWLPLNYQQMRVQRKSALAFSDENRLYVQTAGEYLSRAPAPSSVVYDDKPGTMHAWGVSSAARILTKQPKLNVCAFEDDCAREALSKPDVVILSWDHNLRRVSVLPRRPGALASTMHMEQNPPVWQFQQGWFARRGSMRWIEPRASVLLHRPAGARRFAITVNAGPQLLERVGTSKVELLIDGQTMGTRSFDKPGHTDAEWPLPPAAEGDVRVEFHVEPEFRTAAGARPFGIAIVSFGFMAQ